MKLQTGQATTLRALAVQRTVRWLPLDDAFYLLAEVMTSTRAAPLVVTQEALLQVEAHADSAVGAFACGVLCGATYRDPKTRVEYLLVEDCERTVRTELEGDPYASLAADISRTIARVERNGRCVVGWYRFDVPLGQRIPTPDVGIHRALFPEPWQVALLRNGRAGEGNGVFVRVEPNEGRAFSIPFLELVPRKRSRGRGPMLTSVRWRNYSAESTVAMLPHAEFRDRPRRGIVNTEANGSPRVGFFASVIERWSSRSEPVKVAPARRSEPTQTARSETELQRPELQPSELQPSELQGPELQRPEPEPQQQQLSEPELQEPELQQPEPLKPEPPQPEPLWAEPIAIEELEQPKLQLPEQSELEQSELEQSGLEQSEPPEAEEARQPTPATLEEPRQLEPERLDAEESQRPEPAAAEEPPREQLAIPDGDQTDVVTTGSWTEPADAASSIEPPVLPSRDTARTDADEEAPARDSWDDADDAPTLAPSDVEPASIMFDDAGTREAAHELEAVFAEWRPEPGEHIVDKPFSDPYRWAPSGALIKGIVGVAALLIVAFFSTRAVRSLREVRSVSESGEVVTNQQVESEATGERQASRDPAASSTATGSFTPEQRERVRSALARLGRSRGDLAARLDTLNTTLLATRGAPGRAAACARADSLYHTSLLDRARIDAAREELASIVGPIRMAGVDSLAMRAREIQPILRSACQ